LVKLLWLSVHFLTYRWRTRKTVGRNIILVSKGGAGSPDHFAGWRQQSTVFLAQGTDMADLHSPLIHPTAIISVEAVLASDVQIGPHAIIEGKVEIGPGCVIRPYAYLRGSLTMGSRNVVFSGAVLGEDPQHLKYRDEPTLLEIGDGNVFREHVTVHRGTTASGTTRIGNGNFFMANSHIAHDCRIGNHCIFANGALVAGHCRVDDGVYLSGNCAVHQFVRMGRLSLLSGVSATTKDVPPFIIQQGINNVVGVNVIGMKRSGMDAEQIDGVRRAFIVLYRQGLTVNEALARIEKQEDAVPAVQEFVTFIRESGRGINLFHERHLKAA
jgi:UDP-N-acetylglucosamine acyltransferase